MKTSVSIIVPMYNSAKYLNLTLANIAEYSTASADLELVLVDDGSTDNTAEIASNFLKTFKSSGQLIRQNNQGPSAAKNSGLKKAQGEWIQFLDADDTLHKEKIDRQLEFILEYQKSESQPPVVYSPWMKMDVSGIPIGEVFMPQLEHDTLTNLLVAENFSPHASQLFHISWLKKAGGYDEKRRFIEDVHLNVQLAIAGAKFVPVPGSEALFFYRQHAESLSHSDDHRFVDGCMLNADEVLAYFKDTNGLTPKRAGVLADAYFYGVRFYARRDHKKFMHYWNKIKSFNPEYLPKSPGYLRLGSRLLGYPRAERITRFLSKYRGKLK